MKLRRFATSSLIVSLAGLSLAGCSLIPNFLKSSSNSTAPQNKLDLAANVVKFSAIVASGKSGECTIVDTSIADASPIEIQVKGKNFLMKGKDFSSSRAQPVETDATAPATVTKKIGFLLTNLDYTYIWEEGATTGIKFKNAIPTGTSPTETSETSPTQVDDINPLSKFETDGNYRIDCQMKDIPDANFVAPATVNFMDLNQNLNFNPATLPQEINEDDVSGI